MINKEKIKFLRSLHSRAGRTEAGVFIAEGEKLIEELKKTLTIDELFVAGENCSSAQMARISMLKTPSSMLATFHIPTPNAPTNGTEQVVVLDGVQDPGNLGTILRTAQWFGISEIVCSPACVDIYNPKVVQATMGALGKIKVTYTELNEWISRRKELFPRSIYGTFLSDSTPVGSTEFHDNATIVVGSEGSGISAEVEALCDHRITISRGIGGSGESLNVGIATAIILYQSTR